MRALLLAVLGGAAAVFLTGFLILDAAFGRTVMQRRLAALRDFTVRRETERLPPRRRLLNAAGQFAGRHPVLLRLAERDADLLDRLGGALRPPEWLMVRLTAAVVTALVLAVATWWPVGLPLGLLAGFFGANTVLRYLIGRREQSFADELPGALHLMVSSLRSGFTLHQSIEAAVRDDEGPVAGELRRALAEARISGDFEDALERIGERMRSTEMVWLVMALRLQKEVGGSLVDVMQTTADTMRERAYLRRHVRALSGEGRISAYVLTSMPLLSAGAIYVTEPSYLVPLFTEPAGLVMLVIAAVAMTVGALWLRVVVRVEV